MIPKRSGEMIKEFRQRGQKLIEECSAKEVAKKKPTHVPPRSQRQESSPYTSFLKKYNSLEDTIDSFKTRDFVYYFREISEESGHRYIVSNIKKDMAIFKRLTENFTPREICCMIEFLYQSEQDYLDKDRLSPNVLASAWINTIYADMKLWVNDEYTPKSKKKHKSREWTAPVDDNETNVKIGEWD